MRKAQMTKKRIVLHNILTAVLTLVLLLGVFSVMTLLSTENISISQSVDNRTNIRSAIFLVTPTPEKYKMRTFFKAFTPFVDSILSIHQTVICEVILLK